MYKKKKKESWINSLLEENSNGDDGFVSLSKYDGDDAWMYMGFFLDKADLFKNMREVMIEPESTVRLVLEVSGFIPIGDLEGDGGASNVIYFPSKVTYLEPVVENEFFVREWSV